MALWLGGNSLSIWQWAAKAVIIFLWLFAMARVMGQRQISQMTLFDFTVAITIGSVAGGALASTQSGTVGPLTVIAVVAGLNVLIALPAMRFSKLRRVFQGEPLVLVKDGRLMENTMRRARLNLDHLLECVRLSGIAGLSDVEFAVLEPSGRVSVMPRSQARPATPSDLGLPTAYEGMPTVLIEDGHIVEDNLKENLLDRAWLMEQLGNQGVHDPRDVMAAMLDTKGRLFVSLKAQRRRLH